MMLHLRPAIVLVVLFTLLLGLALPLGITGLAGLVEPGGAGGSLVMRDGQAVGSSLIGQSFTRPGYFQTRPSATTAPDPKDASKTVPLPDNAANSGASNLAPTAKALIDRVKAQIGSLPVPAGGYAQDAVTSSASGLDPDISPENAAQQVARVAAARGMAPTEVERLVGQLTRGAFLGVFGGARVNVLALNMALDERGKSVSGSARTRQRAVALWKPDYSTSIGFSRLRLERVRGLTRQRASHDTLAFGCLSLP